VNDEDHESTHTSTDEKTATFRKAKRAAAKATKWKKSEHAPDLNGVFGKMVERMEDGAKVKKWPCLICR
jgi:hypothetical protein